MDKRQWKGSKIFSAGTLTSWNNNFLSLSYLLVFVSLVKNKLKSGKCKLTDKQKTSKRNRQSPKDKFQTTQFEASLNTARPRSKVCKWTNGRVMKKTWKSRLASQQLNATRAKVTFEFKRIRMKKRMTISKVPFINLNKPETLKCKLIVHLRPSVSKSMSVSRKSFREIINLAQSSFLRTGMLVKRDH